MPTVKEIAAIIEEFAPLPLQESYDNAGLIYGNPETEVTSVLLSLDCTEEVVQEAIKKGCNMIISHHPVVFSGIKKLTGKSYVERTLIKAIKAEVAIYAAHTNLDNVHLGVNWKICQRLGLSELKVLEPKANLLRRLIVFAPEKDADKVRSAMFEAGAGTIGEYDQCSFNTKGTGTFRPSMKADPHIGEPGKFQEVTEQKIEVIYPYYDEGKIMKAMRAAHPYEEVAYDVLTLGNKHQEIGSGMIGELDREMETAEFLNYVKKALKAPGIRYTEYSGRIKRVAVCGGSGSFLLSRAISAGADAFITGDFKYHQFFDAEGRIMICDAGHYETEQFTVEIFYDLITKKMPNFAVCFSETNTNPINYLS